MNWIEIEEMNRKVKVLIFERKMDNVEVKKKSSNGRMWLVLERYINYLREGEEKGFNE